MPSDARFCTRVSDMIPPQWLHPCGPCIKKLRGSNISTLISTLILLAISKRKYVKKEPAGPPPTTATCEPSLSLWSDVESCVSEVSLRSNSFFALFAGIYTLLDKFLFKQLQKSIFRKNYKYFLVKTLKKGDCSNIKSTMKLNN